MVSVKTEGEIPKDKIQQCMEEIGQLEVKEPVHVGDVLIPNVAGTGIRIVATSEAED